MPGFSSVVGLSKIIADALYDAIGAATAAINGHKDVTTGIHGVGGSTIAIASQLNILGGINPAFGDWGTNPGSNADLVDEAIFTNLTTAGASAGVVCVIEYDLGSLKRVNITAFYVANAGRSLYIDGSPDNATWYPLITPPTAALQGGGCACNRVRYIRFRWTGAASAVNYSIIKLGAYVLL